MGAVPPATRTIRSARRAGPVRRAARPWAVAGGVPRDRGGHRHRRSARRLLRARRGRRRPRVGTPAAAPRDGEPGSGGVLRRCREAAATWFAEHPDPDVPRSVIHGDFTPWKLLFAGGRLTGLLDFEATHHTFQVADFALPWRGHQDDVLRGYDEVRALSELEWHLVQPTYWAWLLLGVKDALAAHDRAGPGGHEPPNLRWQVAHARRHSPLIAARTGTTPPWS
ncbi:phosphotransferase [Micromonospora sp. NPDC051300]|uniref:phosphotransferase n=1 Tax=Micromonospora sp. NPDC051300 TaxID=3364286 RepID=UPI0037BC3C69